jgi:hypothetical protein
MWNQVQQAFIAQFSEIQNEKQAATTLCYAKKKKYDLVEDYHN